jgi:DNA-binding NarL/FixJ family response regulator
MQDIFVTTLRAPIDSWEQAFPNCLLIKEVSEAESKLKTVASDDTALVFWLHINDQQRTVISSTIAEILKRYRFAKIVVLDNAPGHEQSIQALSTGAMGYAHAYSPAELLAEVKAVITHGGLWLGQQLLQKLIETTVKLAGNSAENVEHLLSRLTKRERQVALEAAKGLSNKEIARNLQITDRTVKAHLAASFERLKVKDRLQLALLLNKQHTSARQGAYDEDADVSVLKVG